MLQNIGLQPQNFAAPQKMGQFASVCTDLHGRTHFFWSNPEFLPVNV
jgi:hypothetical protein